jgi:sRNA-binding protein
MVTNPMSKTARRAQIGAVTELLCVRFPQTFDRRGPWPLKIGLHTDLLAALGDDVRPRDLKSALRAYTSNARYLHVLSEKAVAAGMNPMDLKRGIDLAVEAVVEDMKKNSGGMGGMDY